MSKLPWEPGFVPAGPDQDLIGTITGALNQAENAVVGTAGAAENVLGQATQIGSTVATDAATVAATAAADAAKAAVGAAQAAGEVVTGVAATSPPTSPAAATTSGAGDLLSVAISAAQNVGRGAVVSILPDIEKALETRVAAKVQTELTMVLKSLEGGENAPAIPTLDDFTKADARSRAIRTLLLGVVLSGLWGLVNVLGNIATVDWTNRNALPQVISIAVTGVAGAVVAYVGRLFKEPAHVTHATIIPGTTGKTF